MARDEEYERLKSYAYRRFLRGEDINEIYDELSERIGPQIAGRIITELEKEARMPPSPQPSPTLPTGRYPYGRPNESLWSRFWNAPSRRKEGFKINLGKFFFVMFVIAASLVLPFIFKESGSAWFLSLAVTIWAIGTLFPSTSKYVDENGKTQVDETKNGLLFFKASLNGVATIFLSLGLIAISPSTPFMRLLTLVVFTIAYLSFPTTGGDEKYKAYLASWRMFLGMYFAFFFIFAFMNVLSVSSMLFFSLLLLAIAFYINLPETESAASLGKWINLKINLGEGGTGGMMFFGIMIMVFGASMALFLGGMKIFGFSAFWLASLTYFFGILVLLASSASGASGETVLFSILASIGLALGAFDLWWGKHYFAAMGYNILVGMSISTGAASVQARPIIGVTALSFAIIILTSAYPAVLGEAVFGQWWPQVEQGVTTLVGPMSMATEQMQESFQNAFLMFSCPSCYYEKQLEKQQANANVKSGGTVKSIEVSDFTFQVVNIPEQPLVATATLENKGEFAASNIQAKVKNLQTKNKKGTYRDWPESEVTRKFVTCSGGTFSESKDSCTWSGSSYSGDMKQITFKYGENKEEGGKAVNGWGNVLGGCECRTSGGKLKGYCKPTADDVSGCKKCAEIEQFKGDSITEKIESVGTGDVTLIGGLRNTCDINNLLGEGKDTISYEYGGSYIVVGFDYSFNYIVNVSLDMQLMQGDTLNDLLLKKQITLRDVRADYSGGPVKASIWTQKQPVRAKEETLAVISVENVGTGTVKSAASSTCVGVGGVCRLPGVKDVGDCYPIIEKKIEKECEKETSTGIPVNKVCCVDSSYSESSEKGAEYVFTMPFISGISPDIKEVSRGGLNCGDMKKEAIIDGTKDYTEAVSILNDKTHGGKGRILKTDSYELHCKLESNLEKGKFARYAFTFNYNIPPEIDRKSVIFVGNVNYQYQNSKTMESVISWAPPQ